MKFRPSPPWLVTLFDGLLATTGADRRVMFSYPAGFVNGHMFTGLFADSMIVRLDEASRAELLAREGAALFDPMGGRPMREYVVVPHDLLEDEEALRGWMLKALAFAEGLPPKAPRGPPAARPVAGAKKAGKQAKVANPPAKAPPRSRAPATRRSGKKT